jgi:tetratricopeptide (TPR) repeat protein
VRTTPLRGLSLLAVLVAVAASACVSPYERGERLYRQGDLRGALEVWHGVPVGDDPQIQERLPEVEAEFERLLLRYEKRAEFFEAEGRLAEAVLFYRLALKLDPNQPMLLNRVQELVRVQQREARERNEALDLALAEGHLREAGELVSQLSHLDPFDPSIQIEVRKVRGAVGAEVQRHLEVGQEAFAAGNRAGARRSFHAALELDARNETALGYLSYLRRFEEIEEQPGLSFPPSPPETISEEEILAEGHFHAAEQAEVAGEPYRAIAEYQAALRINPHHRRARQRLERVRDGLRPQITALYEIGKRYFQEEDLNNALRTWRRLLLIDPGHQRTRENVERAERMLSRLEEIQTGGR